MKNINVTKKGGSAGVEPLTYCAQTGSRFAGCARIVTVKGKIVYKIVSYAKISKRVDWDY